MRDASPQFGHEDLEELLSSALITKFGHRQILLVEKLITCLLVENEARAQEIMKEEVDNGLHILHDHGAPHDDVSKIEHLAKEV